MINPFGNLITRDEHLRREALSFLESGEKEKAFVVAKSISPCCVRRYEVVQAIFAEYVKSGDIEKSFEVAETITEPGSKQFIYEKVFKNEQKRSTANALKIGNKLLEIMQRNYEATPGLWCDPKKHLKEMAEMYLKSGNTDQAFELARKIPKKEWESLNLLQSISLKYLEDRNFAKAFQVAKEMSLVKWSYERNQLLEKISLAYANLGEYDLAADVVKECSDVILQSKLVKTICEKCFSSGQRLKAAEIAKIMTWDNEVFVAEMVEKCIQLNDTTNGIKFAKTLRPDYQAKCLVKISLVYLNADLEKAYEVAKEIPTTDGGYEKSQMLRTIHGKYLECGWDKEAKEIEKEGNTSLGWNYKWRCNYDGKWTSHLV